MADISALLAKGSGIYLDICCGQHKQGADWVGIDIQNFPGVDILWDINDKPWPLPDNCVRFAIASHIVEHIPAVAIDNGHTRFPFIEFMNECWRVIKPDGEIAIAYPHGRSDGFMQDPTHCHSMNETVWAYFDPLEPNTGGLLYKFYQPKPWKIKSLSWNPSVNVEVVLIKRLDDPSYHE